MVLLFLVGNSLAQIEKPESYRDRLERARRLRIEGHVEEALTIYNAMLEKSHRDVDALVGRGYCYTRDSETLDHALTDFEKAIVLTPTYIDAYIGAATVLRRQGKWDEAGQILLKCEKANANNPSRLRYLAITAWRESQFILARRLDEENPPEKGREILSRPSRVSTSYSYHNLTRNRDDWHSLGAKLSHKPRPDASLSVGFKNWWRYGKTDWSARFGASYRHSYRTSLSYDGAFSDKGGFLADQKHKVMARRKLFKRARLGAGISFKNYGNDWSERYILEARQTAGNFFGRYKYSWGTDSKDEDVETHSFSLGYEKELRYSISATYTDAEETIEIPIGADDFDFLNEDVDTISIRVSYYFTHATGIYLGWTYETREEELFRRAHSISAFHRF